MEKRRSDCNHTGTGILLSCLLLALSAVPLRSEEKAGAAKTGSPPREITVALREIPVWEVHEQVRSEFLSGLSSLGGNPRGDPSVRYPALKSSAPVYGAMFTGNVLASRPLANRRGLPGVIFVLDQSAGRSEGYDLLYFDENADDDLTNDTPRKPLKDVPAGLTVRDGRPGEQTWFESVKLTLNTPGTDPQVIELLPYAWKYEERPPTVRFVPARVHTGRFEVNGKSYEAFLGYQYRITPSLNEPTTALRVMSSEGRRVSCLGTEQLSTLLRLDDKYYRCSCTPAGDKLFIQRYDGPLGVLELGAGGRNTQKLEMMGELSTKEFTAVMGQPFGASSVPQGVSRCEIPVGDYQPRYMTITVGQIQFAFSENYYPEVGGQVRLDPQGRYGIAIRQDKPFVLDFANKPVVRFVRPTSSDRLSLGSEARIEAVLVDPVLDIMIRQLDDMSHAEKRSYPMPGGQEITLEQGTSLEPKVTIARSNGEIIAEGVMPFG